MLIPYRWTDAEMCPVRVCMKFLLSPEDLAGSLPDPCVGSIKCLYRRLQRRACHRSYVQVLLPRLSEQVGIFQGFIKGGLQRPHALGGYAGRHVEGPPELVLGKDERQCGPVIR